jgi:hypothetical protein
MAANDDRKPSPLIKADPILQNDTPHLPEDYGISQRRARMHPESEPAMKRAEKQYPPCRSYTSQNAANDGGCKPAARKTPPTYQVVAQIKREPTLKNETAPDTSASGQEIEREPALKIENAPDTTTSGHGIKREPALKIETAPLHENATILLDRARTASTSMVHGFRQRKNTGTSSEPVVPKFAKRNPTSGQKN